MFLLIFVELKIKKWISVLDFCLPRFDHFWLGVRKSYWPVKID